MIIDAEDAPKSPVSPHPTFRQNPTASQSSRSYPVSYSTFSQTPNATNDSRGASEVSTLLYHHQPQAFYDDAQPPAYEDINHNKPKARNRSWTRCAAVFLLICLVYSSWASYRFSKGRRNAPGPPRSSPTQPPTGSKPNVPSAPQNPPRTQPSGPPAVPSPTLAPPPPLPPRDHLPSDPPFVIPTRGRVDLCQSWAYSMDVGSRPSIFDNRPTDQVEYTVPSLEPLHIETGAICPTENGSNELCGDYNDTLDSIAGKLVVTAGDVKLPEIRVTLQHGSKSGLDNISMCLMKKPRNEAQGAKGGSKWVLGLYAWKDRSNDPENYIVVSATIVLTLPKSGVHNLSTGLNYFSQSVGPRGDHDHGRSGTMTFDTLAIHAGVRGEVLIQNVTAAAIKVKTENDNVAVVDCRVSRLVDLTSEAGIVASVVTLVQTEDTPRVEMKMQSTFGAASANTTLEYSPTLENPPRFQIDSHSEYGVSAILVNDPRGTQLLRAHETPPILPIIHINSTSRLAIAQAVVPPTYYGSVQLESQYTSVVVQDHASEVPGRIVEWDRRGQPYRGNVRFNGYHRGAEAGSVYVATQYATSRMLFWGLDDDQTSGWPEHGGVIVLGKF